MVILSFSIYLIKVTSHSRSWLYPLLSKILRLSVKRKNYSLFEGFTADADELTLADENGNTLLHLAALESDQELMAILIGKGADVLRKNVFGSTPLEVFQNTSNEEFKGFLPAHELDASDFDDIDLSLTLEVDEIGLDTFSEGWSPTNDVSKPNQVESITNQNNFNKNRISTGLYDDDMWEEIDFSDVRGSRRQNEYFPDVADLYDFVSGCISRGTISHQKVMSFVKLNSEFWHKPVFTEVQAFLRNAGVFVEDELLYPDCCEEFEEDIAKDFFLQITHEELSDYFANTEVNDPLTQSLSAPLLTHDEEKRLLQSMDASLVAILDAIKTIRLNVDSESKNLLKKLQDSVIQLGANEESETISDRAAEQATLDSDETVVSIDTQRDVDSPTFMHFLKLALNGEQGWRRVDFLRRPSLSDLVFMTPIFGAHTLEGSPASICGKHLRRYLHSRNLLVMANTRLVRSLLGRYKWTGLDEEELFQVGTLGLLQAVEKANYKLGWKLSTYATWWIRQRIGRDAHDLTTGIRIPVHRQESLRKYKKSVGELERLAQIEGQFNDIKLIELKEALGLSTKDVLQFQETPILYNESDLSLHDKQIYLKAISDPLANFFAPDYLTIRLSTSAAVIRLLSELKQREADVISFRFGLLGDEAETLEQVGQRFGVTRERIRQIELKALGKLRFKISRDSIEL